MIIMIKKTFKGDKLNVTLSELLLLEIDKSKTYDLVIKEHRKKRSLDANAYCWVLLGKLSQKLRIPAEDLYREFIRRIGGFEIVAVQTKALENYINKWRFNGIGWVVDDLGEGKSEGYHILKCYYGSSSYDGKEMSAFIDEIAYACKEQGIETATGAELALLKEDWAR